MSEGTVPPDGPPVGTAGTASPVVPVCPRHPDRVSYVRCQRCERPVCPECQRPAAVGVHCVDCVRAANRTAAQPRSAFGAPLRGGRPVVTLTLIGLNVVSYVLNQIVGRDWTIALGFIPAVGASEPYRLLTTAFLHSQSSIFHILFNMYALYVLGQFLEPALGRWRFTALYLLSAVGGSVMFTLLASPDDRSWVTLVVGASGAVFGLFGAIAVVLRRLGRSAQGIIAIVVINTVIGFVLPGIAWEAHLGGLLVGIGLGAAYAYAPRKRRTEVSIAATVLTAAVLIVLMVAKYASI